MTLKHTPAVSSRPPDAASRSQRQRADDAYGPFSCGCGERSTVIYDDPSDQFICGGCGKSEPPLQHPWEALSEASHG